tara:strand:+ start:1235 stop:1405 length:171 start_codon:yes stop_codon:yes gene_type:complete
MVGDMMVVLKQEVVPVVVVVEAVVPVRLVKMVMLLIKVEMVEQVFNYHQPSEIQNL